MTNVCVYEDPTMYGTHGITAAVSQQQKALTKVGATVKTKPIVPYEVFHANWYGPISYIRLRQVQQQGKLGVVFAHSGKDIVGGFTLSTVLTTPFIKWLVTFYNSGDLVIAPSQYTKDMITEFGVDPSKIHVVSNGVDTEAVQFSQQKRKRYRNKFNLNKPTVFCVGQVIPRKGVTTFVEVARQLPQYNFIWFGHRMNKLFMYDREMDKAIKSAPSNVQFTGYVEDIQAAYSAGDLFFFPSHEENQGIVLLEAAIRKAPIVARDLPVYKGWLKNETHCLIGNNKNDFTSAINRLMNDSSPRNKLTKNASTMAREHSLDKIGRRYLELYDKAC